MRTGRVNVSRAKYPGGMRRSGRVLGALVAVAAAGSLSACAVAPSEVVGGSRVTVAVDVVVDVLNPGSTAGETAAALGVDSALYSGFTIIDSRGRLLADSSFGVKTVLSEDPLTVRYTVADSVRWSDGVPLDAVDLLLDWAAHSGRWGSFAASGSGAGSAGLSAPPELSADRKSLTLVYADARFSDTVQQFAAPMPAHVVAAEVLGIERPEVAKDAVIAAVDSALAGNARQLALLATFWNTGFAADAPPGVLVSSGPYVVASAADRTLELRTNAEYAGDRRPKVESVRIVTLPARDGMQALLAEEAEVLAVAPDPVLEELVPSLGLRMLTAGEGIDTFVAVQRQTVTGVEVGADGRRVLWNLSDWASTR